MSELNDFEVLSQLESTTEWNSPALVETDSGWLLSLDAPCNYLVRSFADYTVQANLATLTGGELIRKLAGIALKMGEHFNSQQELLTGCVIQTRGDAVCLTYDERALPSEHILLDDGNRLRGTFVGIDILPIRTDRSLAGDELGVTAQAIEPTLCLIIENTNIRQLDDINTFQDVMAIVLRPGGVHLDQVITRRPTITEPLSD